LRVTRKLSRGPKERVIKFLFENLVEINHMQDRGVDCQTYGEVSIKTDLKRNGGTVWTGFFPHRTGAVSSTCGNERVIKCEEFHC
jgi:hypothetical protein